MESLGQVLFAPPSVKGWDGGPTWLNAQTLLGRNNLALAIVENPKCDPAKLLADLDEKKDIGGVDAFLGVFLQGDVPAESRARLIEYANQARNVKFPVYWTDDDKRNHRTRAVAHLALTLPEFQLC